MKFTFLSAAMPLTKSYAKLPDGTISKSSYPHAYEFTSHVEEIANLHQLEAQLLKHAELGHCLLKGNTSKPLVSESRAGSTSTQDVTNWLCFDIDGLDISTVEDFMTHIGLPDVSYIIQWSASYKVTDDKLRCHVFVLMSTAVSAPLVKQWLMSLNHSVSPLRNGMSLTKTGNSLSWPLDITACQNDKLLYIAAPSFKGMKSPLGTGAKAQPRISLVKKKQDVYVFPTTVNAGKNQDLTDKRILELRAEQGMPKRKLSYKTMGGNTVMVKPDSCDATEIRHERGFVYFNINGGDSWGYWHPEDNPQFIYNFKGEPTYLTSELLPDYWKSLQQAGSRESSSGQTYLGFSDSVTGVYYKGTYDKANDELNIVPAKTLIILDHYMRQNGLIMGDFVPEWERTFDPQNPTTVDVSSKFINLFQLSQYMKQEPRIVKQCPPTIFRFIHHALGSDANITEHFLNWVAVILQTRDRTLTSWVLHGVQGTGKGVLISHILRPLFGLKQTAAIRMRDLGQQYNGYLRQSFLVYVDEMKASAMMDEHGVMADLKNFVTEPYITVRDMYAAPIEVRNYSNWIVSSNEPDPLSVPRNDRRTNVAKYQPEKFYPTPADLTKWPADEAKIAKEMQAFHDFLFHYPADKTAAATPIQTEDRDILIDIGENAIDTVSAALLDGKMDFLLEQLPTSNRPKTRTDDINRLDDYRHTLRDLLIRTDALTGKVNIARDELRAIYEYTIGKIPESPNKFTALLKHHRIHTKKVWVNDRAVYGISTAFKDVAEFDKYLKTYFPQSKVKA